MHAPPHPPIAVFDLDGTLTWHDTLLPFLAGYVARHPGRLLRLWRLPAALWNYFLGAGDRGVLKAAVISMVMGGDERARIDAWADAYVAALRGRGAFRPEALAAVEAHRRAGERLVLLSASPDLYVPRVGSLLGFATTICTEVVWRGARLDGALKTANRRGHEKRRCIEALRAQYPGAPIAAYGNSASDLPHLTEVERPLLVNASGAAQRLAAAAKVPIATWR
jgi:phosphatidylglycerophosphatase C